MRIYVANDLFNDATRAFNEQLAIQLRKLGAELYVPQENNAINDKEKSASAIDVYEGDTTELLKADAIIAILDGIVIDPGVAAEIGFMAALNEFGTEKKIYGLFTDCREMHKTANEVKLNQSTSEVGENQFPYLNVYVTGAVKKYGKIFTSITELLKTIEKDIFEENAN